MTAQVSNPPAKVAKAAVDQMAAWVASDGFASVWQKISAAPEDKISAPEKASLLNSITSAELSRAAATVKADGLTPEVLDLLQMLLDLMRGQAQPAATAPAAEPAMPGPADLEARAKADAQKGLPAPQTDSLRFSQEQKEPPPMGAPLRKAEALVLGRHDDLAPDKPPPVKKYQFSTAS